MLTLEKFIEECQRPKRLALSSRFPILVPSVVFTRRTIRKVKNKILLSTLNKSDYLPCIIARHSSPLFRKLGDTDIQYQKNKVINLKIAISELDGLVIPPGKIFSFWENIGKITKKRGYVPGMVISNGKVGTGIGGGLCQLSNLLTWIFLHANTEIVERYHHSVDVFPDSGRTIPFGSGATVFNNYLDLQVKNISNYPIQLKLQMTDTQLKGQLLSTCFSKEKYHLSERNHHFVNFKGKYFRYNEIYREVFSNGIKIKEEKIFTNFAPVVYKVDRDLLEKNKYSIIDYL